MTRSMSLVKRFLVFSALEPATLVISFLPKTCREYSFNCFFLAKMKDSPQISNEICCMIHLLFFPFLLCHQNARAGTCCGGFP